MDPATRAIQPFDFFRWTNPGSQDPHFAIVAHDWLVRHNQSLTIRTAIEVVGYTKLQAVGWEFVVRTPLIVNTPNIV